MDRAHVLFIVEPYKYLGQGVINQDVTSYVPLDRFYVLANLGCLFEH